ncbi:MAG: hypothetical protein ABI840_00440 [bacterium]
MKTIEKYEVPESLKEVWEWKEATSKELYGKTLEEKKSILKKSMEDAAASINATLVKLPNGNYKFE